MSHSLPTKRLIAPVLFIVGLPGAALIGLLLNGGDPAFAVFLVVNPLVQVYLLVRHGQTNPKTPGWVFALIGLLLAITNFVGTLLYVWFTGIRAGWFRSSNHRWGDSFGRNGGGPGSSQSSSRSSNDSGSRSSSGSSGRFGGGKSGGGGAGSSW